MIGVSVPLGALYLIDDLTGWNTPRWMLQLLPLLGMAVTLAAHFSGRHWLRYGRRQPGPPVGIPPGDIPDEVLALLRKGRKIQAIRAYRRLHGTMSLKEAKDVIDGIAER